MGSIYGIVVVIGSTRIGQDRRAREERVSQRAVCVEVVCVEVGEGGRVNPRIECAESYTEWHSYNKGQDRQGGGV